MNFRQISSFIAGPAGLVILLFFFLPWITVSCSGQDLIEASGLDLAQGVDDNDVQVDASDFGFDESMFEDIETGGDFQFDESEAFNEPLISVEDSGVEAGFLEGSDAKLYFLPLTGMIALAVVAGTYFEPRLLNMYTAIGGYILPAGIGLLIMLLKYLEISGDMSDIEQQAIEESGFNIVQLEYQFGWWLTILGLLALFAAGVVAFLFGEQPALAPAVADTERELMLKARSLIEAKQYDEARQLLKLMKNPTAQQWLQKLDELDPFGDPFKETQE